MFRTAISTTVRTSLSQRLIHSTPAAYKTVTEKVSDVADSVSLLPVPICQNSDAYLFQVNKKVGKGLASVIEKGGKVTEAAKEKLGTYVHAS
jgi:hypothetical protein